MPSSRPTPWLALSSVVLASIIGLYYISLFNGHTPSLDFEPVVSQQQSFKAPRANIWTELSIQEADEVHDFLDNIQTSFDFGPNGTRSIQSLEILRPNKTDALPYLDSDAHQPSRWAQLVAIERGDNQTAIAHYMVGPLPVGPGTIIKPLNFCFNSGRNYIRSPVLHDASLQEYLVFTLLNAYDVLEKLVGFGTKGSPGIEAGLRVSEAANSTFVGWINFFGTGERSGEWSLQPHGLYVKVKKNDNEPEEWVVSAWAYNGVVYDTVDALRKAMKSPNFQILPKTLEGPWTDSEDFEAQPYGRDIPPPVIVQPHGPRYQIDHEQKYVSWLGWTFYLATSGANGVALFDVSFQGSRILYSLELQEALSQYAGSDPGHGGLWFFDSYFGMGLWQIEMVPGYDCPVYATYLNTSYHWEGDTRHTQNSICIFEYTADHPLTRHTGPQSTTVSRNTYLVVRFVSTVGNYDYNLEYVFYLDGTMEVKYRASGYIISAFYPPWEDQNPSSNDDTSKSTQHHSNEYGYRIHDTVSTALHTHILNYRADFDIAGDPYNTFQRVDISPQTTSYSWDQPEIPQRNTMHLVAHNITSETSLNWPANSQSLYLISALNQTNKHSHSKSYRLMPGTMPGTPAHLATLNSTSLGAAASWATADLFITRQHDIEPSSSSPYSYLTPTDPLIDFSKFLDAEDTVQQDLVVYFNLGNHHVPNAGDVPNTLEHVSGSSVMFVPFNFADRDMSRESVSGVRIDGFMRESESVQDDKATDLRERADGKDTGGKYKVRYFGGHYDPEEEAEGQKLEGDLGHWAGGGKVGPWDDSQGKGQDDANVGNGKIRFVENMNPWILGGV